MGFYVINMPLAAILFSKILAFLILRIRQIILIRLFDPPLRLNEDLLDFLKKFRLIIFINIGFKFFQLVKRDRIYLLGDQVRALFDQRDLINDAILDLLSFVAQ